MSLTYQDLENDFPNAVDSGSRFSDPDLASMALINQYYTFFNSGDIASATAVISNNPLLKTMIINAENLNKLRDGVISIQRFFFDSVEQYIMNLVTNRGNWISANKYTKYEVVFNNGQTYMCTSLTTPIGTLPTNTLYFMPITLKGDQGASGIGLSYRTGGWNTTTQFYNQDCVSYNNILWAAKSNNLNQAPFAGSAYWDKVLEISLDYIITDEVTNLGYRFVMQDGLLGIREV